MLIQSEFHYTLGESTGSHLLWASAAPGQTVRSRHAAGYPHLQCVSHFEEVRLSEAMRALTQVVALGATIGAPRLDAERAALMTRD